MSNPQPPHGEQQPGQPYGQQPHPGTPPQGQPFPGTPPHGQMPPPQGQPYGQPQGQPYGQQPEGQPYGQQPPPPGQPYPPAPGGFGPPPKKSNSKTIAAIAVIVGILVVGGVGFYFFNKSAGSSEVGDCIKVNQTTGDEADVEKIGCDSPEGVYKVGAKLDSSSATCPEGDYTEYIEYVEGERDSGFTLCLTVNVVKGDCLTGLDSPEKTKKVACGGGDVELEIVEVLAGKTDVNECQAVAGAVDGLSYSEPASVVCVKLP